MMELFEAIAERSSYRQRYEDKPVPREDLIKIVNAGIQAPSGCNAQTTSFVVVDDPEVLSQIREVIPHKTIASAPAVIVVLSQTIQPIPNMCFELEDYGAATQNILLAVTALGYASLWLDGVLREENRAERVAGILNIPGGYNIKALLPVGVPAEPLSRSERYPFERRACFNTFQISRPE